MPTRKVVIDGKPVLEQWLYYDSNHIIRKPDLSVQKEEVKEDETKVDPIVASTTDEDSIPVTKGQRRK